jgi:molybdopterin synthase catalytic subunit
MIRLVREAIDYHALTEAVRRPNCGAVSLFLGTVRDLTLENGIQVHTSALDYEAYDEMALKMLERVEAETRERWPIGDIALVHRLGYLELSEVSVAVAVSCPHRAQSFEACRYAIDRLKEIVPIWKRDHRPDGVSQWVHPQTS